MVFLVILCSTLTLANPDYYPYEFSYPSHHTSPVLISLGIGGATFLVLYTIINHFHPSTPVVEFTSENVSINLHPDSVQVEGIYTFSNLHNQENKVKISYPFVINEFIGAPTSITVQTDNGQTLEYKLQDDAIQFELVVPPQSSRNLSISFTQPCYDGGFTYVLTTTQSWGKPLVSAVFTVNVDNTISEFQSNYTLEQVDKTDAFTSYSYQTENFNPDQDMQFSWNEGK
jgi:hypothetical protein